MSKEAIVDSSLRLSLIDGSVEPDKTLRPVSNEYLRELLRAERATTVTVGLTEKPKSPTRTEISPLGF